MLTASIESARQHVILATASSAGFSSEAPVDNSGGIAALLRNLGATE
jgi:hypothetical protein